MAVIYSKMGGPAGANLLVNPRRLSDGLGVNAVDMRRGSGDLRPIRRPVPVIADTPAVSSLLVGSTVTEGQILTFTCTLGWRTVLPAIYSISWGGGSATSGIDYVSPPSFTQGVTLISGNTEIVVPAGVQSFEIRFITVDDSLDESTEDLPLTIGGMTAIGYILDNDEPAGYYCPLDNYREVDPAGTAGFAVSNNIPGGVPLSIGRTDDMLYTGFADNGPTKHGLCWQLRTIAAPVNNINLQIQILDLAAIKANTVYFELLGGAFVQLYDEDGNLFGTQEILHSLAPTWNPHALSIPFPGFLSKVVFIQNQTAGGRPSVANVKFLCSQPPPYCPFDSFAQLEPFNIPSGFTLIEPSYGNTWEAVDYSGAVIPAYYYPQSQNGASEFGSTWVVGNPLDADKTLTITVDNPSTKKFDTVSFEADGAIRIEVWDESASLAGPPSYQFDRVYNVSATYNFWWNYTAYALAHPPLGLHGNIKRVRLSARDPANASGATLGTSIKPANIYRLKLSCSNVVAPRTDVGIMNPNAP